ncbi:hypothetical protein CMO93_05600 [Candidatus Woesearchaeota archaeon]|nr:hypothetical protein [Candidatus Woesearchaeota archaeon]|tara:strand:- start:276 stop:1763 length:1488 start_codon:yes stop_codon:yes gene_type:complete
MKTEICIPITADTVEKALIDIKEAEKQVDLIELRIDFIKDIDNEKLKKLLDNSTKQTIITCRKKQDGGNFSGSEKDKLSLLKKSAELKCNFIDVEFDLKNIKKIIDDKRETKIIASYHNFKETPSLEELEKIYTQINDLNPDLIKIATNASSINDNFEIFNLLKNKENLIAFCMGIRGQISRILAPKYGSCITFASLDIEKESAPGQLSVKEINDVYNASLINSKTKVLGVIGEFAENSQSKYMHNPNFKKKSLGYVYVPFKVSKGELSGFMKNYREFKLAGAAVTIPHKEEIINYIDDVDEIAKNIGAVNTLVNKNGKIIGYNTDYYGAVEALKEKTSLDNKKILVIGAGGAARAIVYGLKKENATITITNRTKEKAGKLANEFKVNLGNINSMKELINNNEIIINTTSVGMYPDVNSSVVKENEFANGKLVMDIVYKPIMTKFIKNAEKSQCKTITGDKMLIYQAIGQFKLWTGQDPDFNLMESKLLAKMEGD